MPKKFTQKQKAKFVELYCKDLESTTIPTVEIAEKLGFTQGCIYVWCEKDEKLGALLRKASLTRADRYMAEYERIASGEPVFWYDEKGRKKECMTADRHIKMRLEALRLWAAALAPDRWSDISKEVKAMLKDMAAIRKKMEESEESKKVFSNNVSTSEVKK